MKTKEFIEKVEKLGFEVRGSGSSIIVSANILDAPIITVRTDELYQIDSRRNHSRIDKKDLDYLFNYTVEYARTPLEKREEEKKYLVEIKTKDATLHLWRATDGSGDTVFIYKNRLTIGQRHFTKKEIESIDARFLQFAIEVTP